MLTCTLVDLNQLCVAVLLDWKFYAVFVNFEQD